MPEVAKDGFTRNRARIEEKLQRKRILGFLEANGMLEHIRALEAEQDALDSENRGLEDAVETLKTEVKRLETELSKAKKAAEFYGLRHIGLSKEEALRRIGGREGE